MDEGTLRMEESLSPNLTASPAAQQSAQQEGRPNMRPYVIRGLLWLLCLSLAFSESFFALLREDDLVMGHDIPLMLLMAAVLFIGLDLKRAKALDIHDREVDYIIGCMAMVIAISVKVLLLPRFQEWDALLRLDVFAMLVFAFGACGLLYGMRSTLHFGPGWVLLFCYNPPVNLMVSTILGGGWLGSALSNLIGLSLAVMIALNRNLMQKAYFGLFAFLLGLFIAFFMEFFFNPPAYLTYLPGVLATLLVIYNTSRVTPAHWVIRRRPPTIKDARLAMVIVILSTVVLVLNPVSRDLGGLNTLYAGPQNLPESGSTSPPGWSVTEEENYDWAGRYFGPGSSLIRKKLTADEYNAEWDQAGLVRTVAVDTLLASDYYQARAFGAETLYSTLSGRRSEVLKVYLGEGIIGEAYTVLDESDFLTYTKLVYSWKRADGFVESVTIIAVDDHRPEARFPELAPSLSRMFTQVLTILLRGNSVTVDTETEYKDLGLVTQVANEIIVWEMEKKE